MLVLLTSSSLEVGSATKTFKSKQEEQFKMMHLTQHFMIFIMVHFLKQNFGFFSVIFDKEIPYRPDRWKISRIHQHTSYIAQYCLVSFLVHLYSKLCKFCDIRLKSYFTLVLIEFGKTVNP